MAGKYTARMLELVSDVIDTTPGGTVMLGPDGRRYLKLAPDRLREFSQEVVDMETGTLVHWSCLWVVVNYNY